MKKKHTKGCKKNITLKSSEKTKQKSQKWKNPRRIKKNQKQTTKTLGKKGTGGLKNQELRKYSEG